MKAVHSLTHRPRPPRQAPQRGVILLVALIVLLVMTLTGLAVVRTSTQGAGMAGSLALKQGATSGADLGLERGMAQRPTPTVATSPAMTPGRRWTGARPSWSPKTMAWATRWNFSFTGCAGTPAAGMRLAKAACCRRSWIVQAPQRRQAVLPLATPAPCTASRHGPRARAAP